MKTNKFFSSKDWETMEAHLKRKAWKEARSGSKARIVRDLQREFMEKVKASEAVANQEKIRRKLRKNEKCMKLLDEVKKHGGPISPDNLDQLEVYSEAEVLKEIKYLRQTIAPNIREKRKVGNRFVKYTKEELVQQIKSVLKPETEELGNLDTLLKKTAKLTPASKGQVDTPCEQGDQGVQVDEVAVFEGQLGDRKVGVKLSKETVQLYHLTRYGFEPDDLSSSVKDWKFVTKIDDYDFIQRRTGVYLRCSVGKVGLT